VNQYCPGFRVGFEVSFRAGAGLAGHPGTGIEKEFVDPESQVTTEIVLKAIIPVPADNFYGEREEL